MTQYGFTSIDPDTTSGTALAALITNLKNAIYSSHIGSSAPSYAVAGMIYVNNSDSQYWYVYIYDGTSWSSIGVLDVVNHAWLPPIGGGLGSITSAATLNLWSLPQNMITISGNTGPITKLAGVGELVGTEKMVTFDSNPTLTYHATQLILPGKLDTAVEAGDTCRVLSLGSGNSRITNYQRASGIPLFETTGHRKVLPKAASYTAARATDVGNFLRFTNSSSATLTLPLTAGQGWKVGDRIDGGQAGTGQVVVAGASGVTVNGNLKTSARWSGFTCEYVDTDTWDVYGAMVP